MILRFWALCVILLLATCAVGQKLRTLRGNVVDAERAAHSRRAVEFQADSSTQSNGDGCTSGSFSLPAYPLPERWLCATWVSRPPRWPSPLIRPKDPLQVRMTPAPAFERIQVSASDETQIPPTPASQIFISAQTSANREASRSMTFFVKRQASLFSAAPAACSPIRLRRACRSRSRREWCEPRRRSAGRNPSERSLRGMGLLESSAARKRGRTWKSRMAAAPTCTAAARSAASSTYKRARCAIRSRTWKFPTGTKILRRFPLMRARSSAIGESPRRLKRCALRATYWFPQISEARWTLPQALATWMARSKSREKSASRAISSCAGIPSEKAATTERPCKPITLACHLWLWD